MSEGRIAYLYGDASVEILSETPEYALIQVEDIGAIEDPGLRKLLFTSRGIMTVPFESLTNEPGGAPLTEFTSLTPQTTGAMGTNTPPPSGAMTQPLYKDPLSGIVTCKGRKAIIVTRFGGKSHVRFLDNNEEADVSDSELKPDKTTPTESLVAIWNSLEAKLNEAGKKRMFGAILQLEYSISYLPEKLREEVEELARGDASSTTLDNSSPMKNVTDTPEPVEKAPDKDFNFDRSDWELIFGTREDDTTSDDSDPLPEPPEEGNGNGEREGDPADKSIKPASDEEVHGMLNRMKAARESFEGGARASFTERVKVSIEAEAEKLDKSGKPVAPKTIFEKNLDRANSWGEWFGE